MTHDIDKDYLLRLLRECVEVESPVGYYPEIHEWLRAELAEMGYEMTVDNNATAYVRVSGKSSEKVVCLGAHLDTIGLVVRGINDDGTLRVRQLGGINYHSIEGETCTVHCRDGRAVAGQVICDHHSTHVFDDARSRERTEDTMAISLVADVARDEVIAVNGPIFLIVLLFHVAAARDSLAVQVIQHENRAIRFCRSMQKAAAACS